MLPQRGTHLDSLYCPSRRPIPPLRSSPMPWLLAPSPARSSHNAAAKTAQVLAAAGFERSPSNARLEEKTAALAWHPSSSSDHQNPPRYHHRHKELTVLTRIRGPGLGRFLGLGSGRWWLNWLNAEIFPGLAHSNSNVTLRRALSSSLKQTRFESQVASHVGKAGLRAREGLCPGCVQTVTSRSCVQSASGVPPTPLLLVLFSGGSPALNRSRKSRITASDARNIQNQSVLPATHMSLSFVPAKASEPAEQSSTSGSRGRLRPGPENSKEGLRAQRERRLGELGELTLEASQTCVVRDRQGGFP